MLEIREITFLQLGSGKAPFDDWYRSIRDKRARTIVASKLRQLQNPKFANYKFLAKGVYELRIFYGPGYRVYFGFIGNTIVLVLGGGSKNSQDEDIAAAIKHWEEYFNEEKKF